MSKYWDLDDILSDCELIRCELTDRAENLSWIDQNPSRSQSAIAASKDPSSSSSPPLPSPLQRQQSITRQATLIRSSSNASVLDPVSRSNTTLRRQHSKLQMNNNAVRAREIIPSLTLEAKAWVSVPLWLATIYATREVMRLTPPAFMNLRSLQEMQADPRNIDLKTRAPHFYRIGIKIASLTEPGSDLHNALKLIMTLRYQEMIVKTSSIAATSSTFSLIQQASLSSHSFLSTPSLMFATKLDLTEREMLIARMRGLIGFARFIRREHVKIECPSQRLPRNHQRSPASSSPTSSNSNNFSVSFDKRPSNERLRNNNIENEHSNKRARR